MTNQLHHASLLLFPYTWIHVKLNKFVCHPHAGFQHIYIAFKIELYTYIVYQVILWFCYYSLNLPSSSAFKYSSLNVVLKHFFNICDILLTIACSLETANQNQDQHFTQ